MTGQAEAGERTGAIAWLERRTGIGPVLQASLHVRVPISAKTFYFGGIALFLFAVQAVTGTLLALYYKPTADAAYDSVKFITSDVSFGWLIRSVHHWGANLMILFVVLHMVRIFLQAAYKYPRELVWIVGGLLLMVTVGFGFTGYLLPWDQKAFWATTVGTEIAGSIPVVGDFLLNLLRGGADVTDATLIRFFGTHVLVLPISLAGILVIHLLLVHQLGLASRKYPEPRPGKARGGARPPVAAAPAVAAAAMTDEGAGVGAPVVEQPAPAPSAATEPALPFWPNYLLDEVIAWYAVIAILVVLASVFPAGLEPKADPLQTPAHIKPEWYFLSLYEVLKLVPRLVGVVAPIVGLGVVILLPLIDHNPEIRARRRPLAIILVTLTLAGIVGFTAWGLYS
jgi:ubiquinol-cytochrome c reductase cytochrome b subunit